MMKTEIFQNRKMTRCVTLHRWFVNFLIGVAVGMTAFGMSHLEEWLIDQRTHLSKIILEHSGNTQTYAWIFLGGWCFVLCCIGSILTIKIGPGANGSGIAELIAYLNGVNYPRLIEISSLLIKIFCVILGIAGGLCIGKEGPLAHIGAVMAQLVIFYVPLKRFDYFKNDCNKREFTCSGISAGVSAAFGAPIGGTLFSYELSKPSTFWEFSMLWRTFFCSSVATFTLSFAN